MNGQRDIYRVHLVDQPTVHERWARRTYDSSGRVAHDTIGERTIVPPHARLAREPGPIGRFARRAWQFFLDWLTAVIFLVAVVSVVSICFVISERAYGSGWPGLAVAIALGAALCASGASSRQ